MVQVFKTTALAACSETLQRGERGWGRGNAIRQRWCGSQRSENTALANGVARGGRLRLHPDVTQWRIALARTPRNRKILSVAGQRPASTGGKRKFAAYALEYGQTRKSRHSTAVVGNDLEMCSLLRLNLLLGHYSKSEQNMVWRQRNFRFESTIHWTSMSQV